MNYIIKIIIDHSIDKEDQNIIDHPSILNILKTLVDKSTFDLDFWTSTPLSSVNRLPHITLGYLVCNTYNFICMRLNNFNKKLNNKQYINKQNHIETIDFLKYILNLLIKLIFKSQHYNRTIPKYKLKDTTGNLETILSFENLELDPPGNLYMILQNFEFDQYHMDCEENSYFSVKEYICEMLISLV